jgi:hypothetical protein
LHVSGSYREQETARIAEKLLCKKAGKYDWHPRLRTHYAPGILQFENSSKEDSRLQTQRHDYDAGIIGRAPLLETKIPG